MLVSHNLLEANPDLYRAAYIREPPLPRVIPREIASDGRVDVEQEDVETEPGREVSAVVAASERKELQKANLASEVEHIHDLLAGHLLTGLPGPNSGCNVEQIDADARIEE